MEKDKIGAPSTFSRLTEQLPALLAGASAVTLALSFLYFVGFFSGRDSITLLDQLSVSDLVDHSGVPLAITLATVLMGWFARQRGLQADKKLSEEERNKRNKKKDARHPARKFISRYSVTIICVLSLLGSVVFAWSQDWDPFCNAIIAAFVILTTLFWTVEREFYESIGLSGHFGRFIYVIITVGLIYPLLDGLFSGAAFRECPITVWLKTPTGDIQGELIKSLNRGVAYSEVPSGNTVLVPWSEIKRYAEIDCPMRWAIAWPGQIWRSRNARMLELQTAEKKAKLK